MLKLRTSRIPQMLFLFFFVGSLSMSSLFHNESIYRPILQIVLLTFFALIVAHSGRRAILFILGIAPFFVFFAAINKSDTMIHAFMLTAIWVCLILNRRSNELWGNMNYIWAGSFFALISIMALTALGVTENQIFVVSTSGVVKHSLGFFNPNAAGLLSCGALVAALLARARAKVFLSALVFAYVTYYSASRTPVVILFVFMLGNAIYYFTPKNVLRIYCSSLYLASAMVIAAIAVLAWVPPSFNDPYLYALDEALSKRLSVSLPRISDAYILLPGVGGKSMEFAWGNLIMNFGLIVAFAMSAAGMITSYRVERDLLGIFFVGSLVYFASLFVENIAYSYLAIGLAAFLPTALIIYYFFTDFFVRPNLSGLCTRSPSPLSQ